MSSAVVATYHSLNKIRLDASWLWSMMLTRGLTWDNVWEVYPEGVDAMGSKRSITTRVPEADLLWSLPDSPTTIEELWGRIEQVQQHYPNEPPDGHLRKKELVNILLRRGLDFVQCTWPHAWPQLKNTLVRTHSLSDDTELKAVGLMLDLYCGSTQPALLKKALGFMMEQQHPFVGDYMYVRLIKALGPTAELELWNKLRVQKWSNPSLPVSFIESFAWQANTPIAAMQVLDFLSDYPQVLKQMIPGMIAHGFSISDNGSDAYFAKVLGFLSSEPNWAVELHKAMDRSLPLDALGAMVNAGGLDFRQILTAYQYLPAAQRDTQEAMNVLATLSSKVDVYFENFLNGHGNDRMVAIVSENPMGAMARILALGACIQGLDKDMRPDAIRQCRALFHHDPTSKSGHAAIVRKIIPGLKDWFAVVQGLGLCHKEMWEQGLVALSANNVLQSDVSNSIDGALFEGAMP